MLSLDEKSSRLKYEPIDSQNIHIFRHQNSLLFPVTYPESFYRNLVNASGSSAFLVYMDEICIGSFSTRTESVTRWNDIKIGKTIDNFNPSSVINEVPRICYIMTLGVLAGYRHLGFGAEILKYVIMKAREKNLTRIGLHVHTENHTALKFYTCKGFNVLGKVDDYYRKITPNSAFILELQL